MIIDPRTGYAINLNINNNSIATSKRSGGTPNYRLGTNTTSEEVSGVHSYGGEIP